MREQMKLKMKIRLALQLQYYRILFLFGLKSEEIYYIGGSEALPPPLTRDEEEYLLGKLSSGDAAVRSMLIERNLRLVVYIARKFENTGINIEDLVSIGAIGLIKAVNTFDPEKKIKLATYASRCIENEILMYLRRNSKTRT
ncbi:sigma-70 family RNA polymerase sigma factor, partial [Paenibacillus sp. OT2-17]